MRGITPTQEDVMTEEPVDITMDELRERIRAARVRIPEGRLALVHGYVRDALRPLRGIDSTAIRALEPAVTFDAAAAGRAHGGA